MEDNTIESQIDKLEELVDIPTKTPDKTGIEIEDIERQIKYEEYIGKKQDREQRKDFANKIYEMLCWYLIVVGSFILFVGIVNMELHDNVLIALITTTTASVIGIFTIVAKYLFPTKR